MPVYQFHCECGVKTERVLPIDTADPPCPRCQNPMTKAATCPAMIRIKGQGYPARRKWMDSWTPDSKPFQIGSIHGEKY